MTRMRALAEQLGAKVRRLGDVLAVADTQQRTIAMGRHQLGELRERLDVLERELHTRERDGRPADDLLLQLARIGRAVNDEPAGHTRVAVVLANCIEHAAHLAHGHVPLSADRADAPPSAHFDPVAVAAVGLTARVHGVANLALALFAAIHPDYAVRLDRGAVDRLLTAWYAPSDGGRWPALVQVCRRHLGFKVDPGSVKRELARGRHQLHASNSPQERGVGNLPSAGGAR
jgi:hypothetical protein